jgi:branched-chain amino acid transport system substrate-binding protein
MAHLQRLVAAILSLFVCLAGTAGAQSKPYKVGVILPLTGTGASFGEDGSTGLKLAMNFINAHGGILGRPVVAVIKDDGGDAATASKAALQLVGEEKVDAIIGPPFSGSSAAVLAVTNDAKLVDIATSYLQEEGDAAKNPYAFKVNPSAASVGAAFPRYIKQSKMKRVGILAVDNLQGSGVADGVADGLKKLDIPVVDREVMASGAADVTPQLDRLHAQKPDALVLAMAYGPDYVAALKGLKQIGWINVTPMGTSAINFDVVVKSAPQDILDHSYGSGGYRNLTVECAPAGVKGFQKQLSDEAYNHGPIPRSLAFIATEYDSLMMIRTAVNATKSTSSDAIKKYLETHAYPGIVGTYVYNAQRHDGLRDEDYAFVKAGTPKDGLSEIAPGQSCK